MYKTARLIVIAAAVVPLASGFATQAAAQDENALKAYFEGRHIVLQLDLPGSADGVDVQLDPARGIDYKKYRENLKRYGVAIGSGDTSTVTLIKLKKDLIEFQMGGGGFGTFGDDTSTSSNVHLFEKSEREKTLEERIKDEKDRDRQRALQRDLDDLRDRRERENRILRAESERIEESKRERIAEQRLHSGSRFNLRWSGKVPSTLRPEDVAAALAEYVDFRNDSPNSRPAAGDGSLVRKGMLRDEAEGAFGRPVERSDRREGDVLVTTLIFDLSDQVLTAAFVEDVLVRYTIASK